MIGFPGSGKSSVSKYIRDNHDYIIINQDTLKTRAKCIKEATKEMKNKNSIIIDATNPAKDKRQEWITLAKDYGYTIRFIHMQTSIEQSKHNNVYRSLTTNVEQIPDMGYNMYKSKYKAPSLDDGIEEIIEQEQAYPDDSNYFMYLM